ncbi:MAG: CusA/CzcA family heavy metal efflux RND transporter [Thermoflavifilum aggregans]|nr:CusA/CzcA family heavy metal efflux RND transporter [Thermoflavifilum aggregans]
MWQAIINFSIRHKFLIGIFCLGWIGYGIYNLMHLPIDAVPDITNNQVQVITVSPNLSAPDVERFITVPIEQATRNIPGITEQRSFSRSGLSLVTIVFNDQTDIYWARQQVSERLTQVRSQIPDGMGSPELGPVTTGLGEIYQYVVRPLPGYEGKYSLEDLRDIQDWIVRRQLLGTEGVADVSSFGGLLKQYEVAVHTDRLNTYHLSIADVYQALSQNNQNAGGAYIEKGNNVLFIRTEGLVRNLDDIRQIVIKRVEGVPVYIKDVADVRIGHAIPYGAMVYVNKHHQQEVAGAVVMMLKGGNSSEVIRNVKRRIEEIKKTLPEGVTIEPFLDRTKMVNNAIHTVKKNLIEGALIVIFILVLFLANLRAGLIVASVIPMSMLFAFSMMNLLGVSGNLMSLGALDFGLLVDGAVIIVEAVMHKLRNLTHLPNTTRMDRQQMDELVRESAGKMMSSASFGQIIILIVYLPILSLQGIEGKMFRPMAETVAFAILGALILSLTYVPVVSSLVLGNKLSAKETYADHAIRYLQRKYKTWLIKALRKPAVLLGGSVSLFVISVWILLRLGGEFIPQLEEGDFAVDTRLLTGASLSNTIHTTQMAAKLLADSFPEVEKVVVKIGSGEIPTDPMPVEASDMMVILKDKSLWTKAHTFNDLAEQMSRVLQAVPGIATGFQFPVQMRFNELMTGARQDVVCKIFGDNLDTLAHYAQQLGDIIQTVAGAKDLYVETVTGIPQLVIRYNRAALAQYGLQISDVNRAVQAAYAGAIAGSVFEEDRRYDLVVRLAKKQRDSLNEMQNLPVTLQDGTIIPLRYVADIRVEDGPYQIQREDARRRIIVGFNVRGRDVQSLVNELQQKVNKQLHLPPGYYITYGGEYENLQHATRRLSIAVPVALVLILLILYLAFQRLKYGLMIFSAIPLSAVGGILSLWLRGMPFSISAGVGFIALFGVAVLNGIVMVSEMNRLRQMHDWPLSHIILRATSIRLRPVLMTASVASLGFLPMAVSQSSGAEVQRPLATVVIGGLITATILTLFVLPCIYFIVERVRMPRIKISHMLVLLMVLLVSYPAKSQQMQQPVLPISWETLRSRISSHDPRWQASDFQVHYQQILVKTASDIPKTQLTAEYGNLNSPFADTRLNISQSIAWPAYYTRLKKRYEAELQATKYESQMKKSSIIHLMQMSYVELQYQQALHQQLSWMDSLYQRYAQLAQLQYEKGEFSLLERNTLQQEARLMHLKKIAAEDDLKAVQQQLMQWLQTDSLIVATTPFVPSNEVFDTSEIYLKPYVQYYQSRMQMFRQNVFTEQGHLLPEFSIGYVNQSFTGWHTLKDRTEQYYNSSTRFSSLILGVNIPLFLKPYRARVDAARIMEQISRKEYEWSVVSLQMQIKKVWQDYQKYTHQLHLLESEELPVADQILELSRQRFQNGEIGYMEWIYAMRQVSDIRLQYLQTIRDQWFAAITLHDLLTEF